MTTKLLSRKEASAYLLEKYGSPCAMAPSTLAKLACQGKGPNYRKCGRRAGYLAADLDAWAMARSRL